MKFRALGLLAAAGIWIAAGYACAVEYTGRGLRDPFAKFQIKAGPPPTNPAEGGPTIRTLVLKGIFWNAGNPKAYINNRMVKVGDRFGQVQIVSIEKDAVMVREGSKESILRKK